MARFYGGCFLAVIICMWAAAVNAALKSPHRELTRHELIERERLIAAHPSGPLTSSTGAGATCSECFYFFDLMDDLLAKST